MIEGVIEVKSRQSEVTLRELRSELEVHARTLQVEERALGERSAKFEKILNLLKGSREIDGDPRLALDRAKAFSGRLGVEKKELADQSARVEKLQGERADKAAAAFKVKRQIEVLQAKLKELKRTKSNQNETRSSNEVQERFAVRRPEREIEMSRDERVELREGDKIGMGDLGHVARDPDPNVATETQLGLGIALRIDQGSPLSRAPSDNGSLFGSDTQKNREQHLSDTATPSTQPESPKRNPLQSFANEIAALSGWQTHGSAGLTLKYQLPQGRMLELEIMRDPQGRIEVHLMPEHPRDQFLLWNEKPRILKALSAGGIEVDRLFITGKGERR